MECERCKEPMITTCLNQSVDLTIGKKWKVKRECPVCHLRVYTYIAEGKKL